MHLACWTFTPEKTRKYQKRPKFAESTTNTRKYKLFQETIIKYQKLKKSGKNYQKLEKKVTLLEVIKHQKEPKSTGFFRNYQKGQAKGVPVCNRG